MLLGIAIVLVVLWLLGYLAFHILGHLIHFVVVVAVIFFIWHLITGRR